MASYEERVEYITKRTLNNCGIDAKGKTEQINSEITHALKTANSKSGGSGNNYPDLKFLLSDNYSRRIPVLVEIKGTRGRLIKLDKDGKIELGVRAKTNSKSAQKGDISYTSIQNYAVNSALHYGNAILQHTNYDEVIIVGVNGYPTSNQPLSESDIEKEFYYVSKIKDLFQEENEANPT